MGKFEHAKPMKQVINGEHLSVILAINLRMCGHFRSRGAAGASASIIHAASRKKTELINLHQARRLIIIINDSVALDHRFARFVCLF